MILSLLAYYMMMRRGQGRICVTKVKVKQKGLRPNRGVSDNLFLYNISELNEWYFCDTRLDVYIIKTMWFIHGGSMRLKVQSHRKVVGEIKIFFCFHSTSHNLNKDDKI